MRSPWTVAPALSLDEWYQYRHRVIFDCDKWDPQVEDVSTLAAHALVLDAAEWTQVVRIAESLARETLAAEQELRGRFDLHAKLGLPWTIRNALRSARLDAAPTDWPRVIRFDFHATDDGWRISEANTDVPGGFIESSGMTALIAKYYPGFACLGDPAGELAQAIRSKSNGGPVALLHASAYADDRQVMAYLARRLDALGLQNLLASPDQLRWRDGRAVLQGLDDDASLDAIIRFFPAEWLPNLDRGSGWAHFFQASRTLLCNPGATILTQSKRLPLVWDELRTPMTTWRKYLPETRDPREVDWDSSDDWVVKPAFGRVGEGIGLRGTTDANAWRRIRRDVRWHPGSWIVQRRFRPIPVESNPSIAYPCLGVFTIDERVVGAYGRLAASLVTDYRALDAAVLVRIDDHSQGFAQLSVHDGS